MFNFTKNLQKWLEVHFCDFSVAVEAKRVPVKNISVTNINTNQNTKEFLEEFLKKKKKIPRPRNIGHLLSFFNTEKSLWSW